MKKIALAIVFLFSCIWADAQKLDYNAALEYVFADYEYNASHSQMDKSHTVHAVRLTPEAGLYLEQNPSVFHRLRAGVDLFRQMGEGVENKGLFKEIIFYYNADAFLGNGSHFEAYAGCFPRRYGNRSAYAFTVFTSDLIYLDPNIEGFMLKYDNPQKVSAELILDWHSMRGDETHPRRREKIRILSSGKWNLAPRLDLGWTMSLYHYSISHISENVVDNHMVNPRLEWSPASGLQELRIETGALVSYHRDRIVSHDFKVPAGFYSRVVAGKWNVFLDNRFFAGKDQMPYYDGGWDDEPYGENVYKAELGFHFQGRNTGWVDWFTVRYNPQITPWLKGEAAAMLHFGSPYRKAEEKCYNVFHGWRFAFRLTMDLDYLRPRPRRK